MFAKNEREKALYEYGYMKGLEEAFERMLMKRDLVIGASEYIKSKTIKLDRED